MSARDAVRVRAEQDMIVTVTRSQVRRGVIHLRLENRYGNVVVDATLTRAQAGLLALFFAE